jgi:glycosyltransferase involved in cell wall biosynthesis
LEPDPAAYVAAPDPASPDHSEQVRRRKQAIYARIRDLTLTCPSRWMAAEAGRSALLGGRPIELVPTSCDTALFHPIDKAACRQVLGLAGEPDTILVGATSLGTQWKGLDLFVEAVRRLAAERDRPLRVLTFGRDAVTAAELGDAAEVVHLGLIGDRRLMAAAYGAADVFVAPSRMENLANTVLEALACGTPTAAFAIGGMPDMIDHQSNGWLSPAFDTAHLASGLSSLLDRKDDPALAGAARRKVEQGFSIDSEIERYLGIYERVLEARAATRRN